MGRWLLVVAVAALGLSGWYCSANYSLEMHRDAAGKFQYMRIVPRDAAGGTTRESLGDMPPAAPTRPSIRIASFNVDGLDDARLANPRAADALAKIVTRFDVIALQNIKSRNSGILVRLIEQIRGMGRCYEFATCPTLARDNVDCYNAMLFDLTTVEIDGPSVHSLEDPTNRFLVKPLMGSFRVRGPSPAEAFTFTLVNVFVDPGHGPYELDLLADVYRAVREHELKRPAGGEDDIIMLGDFEADSNHLGRLGHVPGITPVLTGTATTTDGARQLDNILFDCRATTEFTGRSGVLDMVRELDLTPQEAQEISEHLPVYGEFSSYEGGQASHAP
jgi:hypothetical protein